MKISSLLGEASTENKAPLPIDRDLLYKARQKYPQYSGEQALTLYIADEMTEKDKVDSNQNKLIDNDVGWTGPFDRILYFFNPEKQYTTKHTSKEYTNRWMEGNKKTAIMIIALNVYCLYKMHKN